MANTDECNRLDEQVDRAVYVLQRRLERLQNEAREAQERLDQFIDAVKNEDVEKLGLFNENLKNDLASVGGWGKEVF